MTGNDRNLDEGTVRSFGEEWTRFDQTPLGEAELDKMFAEYFAIFPWDTLPANAVGADIGCGSGRWADRVARRVGHLHCLDASEAALAVARRNLAEHANVSLVCASVADMPIAPGSLDFCYSLGVLHHVPDTAAAVGSCARLLKQGAPMLLYLYYALDNRPWWFRLIWRASDVVRGGVSRLPARAKARVTDFIAFTVYWPLSRLAKVLARLGLPVGWLPLAHYRDHSLYTLRTDARDRFGTPLEHRFTRPQIEAMMAQAGLEGLVHSPAPPYWCVLGRKARHE